MSDPIDKEAILDPRFIAAVQLIERTGATSFDMRWSDDQHPTLWMAVAEYESDGDTRWETAAALDPARAVFRLCDQLIDGGMCMHCKRPTGFSEDLDPLPLEGHVCWYQWDPELGVFRRGCEGS